MDYTKSTWFRKIREKNEANGKWKVCRFRIPLKTFEIESIDKFQIVKKNPDQKLFFFLEKNDFEIFDFEKKLKMLIFSSKIHMNSYEFYLKKSTFSTFFRNRKFQNHFSPRKKIIFDLGFFLRSGIYLYFRFRRFLKVSETGKPSIFHLLHFFPLSSEIMLT